MGSVTLPGDGLKVATDLVGDEHVQRVNVANLPATQPVSASTLPLPTGAATEVTVAALLSAAAAIQAAAETLAGRTINTAAIAGTVALDGTSLAALETVSVANFPGTQPVSGTFWQATQPVSGPLTDAQLRATPVPIASTAAQTVDAAAAGTAMYVAGLRQDADSSPVSATGDVHPFVFDEVGRLKVAAQPGQQPSVTGTITTASSSVVVDVSRTSNITIYVTGTFAGVNCTFEGSLDGANYFGVQAIRTNANTIELTTGVLGAAPAYGWELSVNGLKNFRIRATAWTSGTATWTVQPAPYATEPIPGAQISGTQPVSGSVTADTELPAAAALADGATNATTPTAGAAQLLFNGTTWDRARGNFSTTTGDTGAKTATGNGATQTNYNARGATIAFNIGTVSGTTPTMVLKLQGSADGGTTWYDITGAATASLTATGVAVLQVYPGVAAVANSAVSAALPRTWRVVWTVGGTTPSFTITNVQVAYQL